MTTTTLSLPLAKVFEPLKAVMTQPVIMRCPDGHFRWIIFELGPFIADYPEQVMLAGIVQGWCPKSVYLPFPMSMLLC